MRRIFWKDGFYLEGINTIPEGAVEIPSYIHRNLLDKQSEGMVIVTGSDGNPYAVKPEISVEEMASSLRAERSAKIAETDYMLCSDYPISNKNLEELKAYRQALRDLPNAEGFPWLGEKPQWPTLPSFMGANTNE